MSLTPEADAAARYLVQAKDQEMISSYFELIDVTSGSGTTDFELASGLGVHSDDFITPPIGALKELYHNNLINLSDVFSRSSRKWGITLIGALWDYVNVSREIFNSADDKRRELPEFFISYSHTDEEITLKLARHLGKVYGTENIWFDEKLRGGQQWWNAIFDQISRRSLFIYLVSREGLESIYCRIEFTEAWRLQKTIIPLSYKLPKYPVDVQPFQFVAINADPTIDNIVSLIAAITRPSEDTPPVAAASLWAKRQILPKNESIRISVKVPANVEPKDEMNRHLCNTGILLIPGDEIEISASGTITDDNGKTRINSDGLYPHPEKSNLLIFFHTPEAYSFEGYREPDTGNNGVVGTLFGWIGVDKSSINRAFFVGSQYKRIIHQGEEGFLHLAVNDTKGMYWDNEGEFEVDITITHPSN